jgi:hypothetical protein
VRQPRLIQNAPVPEGAALTAREQQRLVGLEHGTDACRMTAVLAAELDALSA